MIAVAPGTRVYLACRPVSMRYGFDGLAAQVAHVLDAGVCLFAKRPEASKFVWPAIVDGRMVLTSAQLGLLVEAMNWRRTVAPEAPRRPVAV